MKKFYITILICTMPLIIAGQISHGGKPLSFNNNIKLKNLAVFKVPKFDYKSILSEELAKGFKSNRYGKVINININPRNSGKWQKLKNGRKIWTLAIKSKGAYSLSLIFDNYKLKNGAKIFVYSSDKQQIIGAFTEQNNKANSWFSTVPVKGDKIIIELNTFNNDDYGYLNISGVVHDYKDVMSLKYKKGYGAAAYCHKNINCPEGANWQIEKKAVAKLYVGGLICTGTLINNTARDSKPYMITAAHCVRTQQKAQTGVYAFNYESEYCKSDIEPSAMSISGANLLSTGGFDLDFSLLELSTRPPDNYDVYYAGWNRNPTLTDDNFVSIHHPKGDVKKINFSKGNIEIADYGLGFVYNSYFKVKEWRIGTTEEGSSGSALFDNEHLIIGVLTGGEATCEHNYNDFYARFDMCWDYYQKSNRQLKKWLDPLNTGVSKLEGMFQNKIVEGYDVAILNSPAFTENQCVNDTMFAKLNLLNFGDKVINTVNIEGQFNDSVVYRNTWEGNLQSRETVKITFPVKINTWGDATVQVKAKLPDYQLDSNLTNNKATKNITLIKPVKKFVLEGNNTICEDNITQEYYTGSKGTYNWTVIGGKVLTDTISQNIKVKWNRWGDKYLNITVSNYCNDESDSMKIHFLEQQLIIKMNIDKNSNNASWCITNESGDTIAGSSNLPESGNISANICIPTGSYNLTINKNGANIKSYTLLRAADNQIILNNNNINSDKIKAKFSLDKFQSAAISLYPNPAKNIINVEASFKGMYDNAQFAIFNESGKTIVPYTKFDNIKTINISQLSRGSYIIKVRSEFGEISEVFIKL